MSAGQSKTLVVATEVACGVVAGPLFGGSFTVIGARRAGYDWRRHAVSSLGLRQTFKKLPDSAIAQVPAADRPFLDDPLIRDILAPPRRGRR